MSESFHFIGIGGIGMSGLARLLLSQKISVTGSDIAFNAVIENLIREGAIIHKGHAAEHVSPHSIVVYTSDVKTDNLEYQAALKMECRLLHRSDLLAQLLKKQKALAVAGTHGKTTTSSLLTTVLNEAGWNPSFAIGGILHAYQTNACFGDGEFFPFEADESDGSFLKYDPYGAIITNIDNDHLNNYNGSMTNLINAFQQFVGQVHSHQHLFWCLDDPYLATLNFPGQSYGFHPLSHWRISSFRQEGFHTIFDLEHQDRSFRQIELALVGKHNVQNAAAVFGLCHTLGVSEQSIRETFRSFKGVLRRCEKKGLYNEVLFLDDYAHHPTEIKTTLQGIRKAIGPKRLIAVFQPHRYTRTQDCLGQYGSIFDDADEVLITDIYGAGETAIPKLSHARILEEIQQGSSVPCRYVPRSALNHYLSQLVQPYDVIVTLGAGDITKVGSETLALLENQPTRHLKVGWIWSSDAFVRYKDEIKLLSSPYITFFEFGMTEQGHLISGKSVAQLLSKEENENSVDRIITAPMLQELIDCDVFFAMLQPQKEVAIQGFLEILGKPYVGSHQKTFLLHEELHLLHEILHSKGIKTLYFDRRAMQKRENGCSLDFVVSGDQSFLISSTPGENNDTQISSLNISEGQEFSKLIYQTLGCQGFAFFKLLLDSNQDYWFDSISPLTATLLFHSVKKNDRDKISISHFISMALQEKRLKQRHHVSLKNNDHG